MDIFKDLPSNILHLLITTLIPFVIIITVVVVIVFFRIENLNETVFGIKEISEVFLNW